MNLLLRHVRIIDPSSPFHLQQADIFIEDGIIKAIGYNLNQQAEKVLDKEGVSVSPGWVDVFAHFPDPGFEYKETLQSGMDAAASGGYTDVLLLPNTAPVVHNKSAVEYIVPRTKTAPVS